ncbi:MAG: hypothetical protein OEY18_13070 [Candidatus Aminicenantes bacterium]|nr:hypothetical protein [Candidatus Aminicenantes bacterium]
MRRVFHYVSFFMFLVIMIVWPGCKSHPTSPEIPQTEDGAWTIYTPFDWTHDGQPYNSVYCTVYSDDASYEMKRQMGQLADEKFNRILQLFNFDDLSDFRYPPGYSRIEIYINRNHPETIAYAYWNGFIITIRSSDLVGIWYTRAVYTATHELTHIFEFLIEGRHVLSTYEWFNEGIAVHTGCLEQPGWQTIENLSELESWISENLNVPGQGNPIRIQQDEDYPPGADGHRYYQFFELAMRYLLDRKGLGKSYRDVLGLFYDMRNGISFPVSFQNHFGISLDDYEIEFYDRMRVYLSQ